MTELHKGFRVVPRSGGVNPTGHFCLGPKSINLYRYIRKFIQGVNPTVLDLHLPTVTARECSSSSQTYLPSHNYEDSIVIVVVVVVVVVVLTNTTSRPLCRRL
jgi:hypothetical protein